MCTTNRTRSVRDKRDTIIDKETDDIWHVSHFVMPLWIYSLVVILLTFTYFVFFSRTKLIIPRAYEIAFESGIWNADQKGSWIRRPPFVCSKTIFSKLKTKKNSGQSKNKFCFSHITRNKAYEAQMVYMQNIQSSLIVLGFSIVPKDNKLK